MFNGHDPAPANNYAQIVMTISNASAGGGNSAGSGGTGGDGGSGGTPQPVEPPIVDPPTRTTEIGNRIPGPPR
jgi:hypothetical protein